jgi:hypothetical protein
MSERSLASSILGGAVLIVLAGVAAYVGARMAQPDAPAADPESDGGSADLDPATRDAIDRRLGYIEKRLDIVEDTARTAIEMTKLREPSTVGPSPAPAPTKESGADAPKPRPADAEPPKPAPFDPADRDAVVAFAVAKGRETARTRVVGEMAVYADTSKEGAANRSTQALSDAHLWMSLLDLRGDAVRDQFVKVFKERLDAAARDIGPIVKSGLERTDITVVRQRLRDLDAETDRKLRPLLDDATWKRYEESVGPMRQSTEAVLDEFEKARLSGK